VDAAHSLQPNLQSAQPRHHHRRTHQSDPAPQQQQQQQQHPQPDLTRLKQAVASSRALTTAHALGVFAFGALLCFCGARPDLIPACFLLFCFIALPWRFYDFYHKKWLFYCIDFCYFVNFAVAFFLLFLFNDAHAEALAYALSDGPLAGALCAWQCAWVFGDAEHTVR